jgi:hypothetical protein
MRDKIYNVGTYLRLRTFTQGTRVERLDLTKTNDFCLHIVSNAKFLEVFADIDNYIVWCCNCA